MSPDGRYLTSGVAGNGSALLWDVRTHCQGRIITPHPLSPLTSLTSSPLWLGRRQSPAQLGGWRAMRGTSMLRASQQIRWACRTSSPQATTPPCGPGTFWDGGQDDTLVPLFCTARRLQSLKIPIFLCIGHQNCAARIMQPCCNKGDCGVSRPSLPLSEVRKQCLLTHFACHRSWP